MKVWGRLGRVVLIGGGGSGLNAESKELKFIGGKRRGGFLGRVYAEVSSSLSEKLEVVTHCVIQFQSSIARPLWPPGPVARLHVQVLSMCQSLFIDRWSRHGLRGRCQSFPIDPLLLNREIPISYHSLLLRPTDPRLRLPTTLFLSLNQETHLKKGVCLSGGGSFTEISQSRALLSSHTWPRNSKTGSQGSSWWTLVGWKWKQGPGFPSRLLLSLILKACSMQVSIICMYMYGWGKAPFFFWGEDPEPELNVSK